MSASSLPPDQPTAFPERRNSWRLLWGGPLYLRRAGEKEAMVLALICMADMYTTLFWVVLGYAREANPALAWTFDLHPVTFVMVKAGSCLPAILLAPKLARRYPTFTLWLLRLIILAYLVSYFKFAKF